MNQHTLLLVEDNPTDADLFRRHVLAHVPECDLLHACRLSEATRLLAEREVEVVFADLGLPDSEGLETLKRIRTSAGDTAVVVLTGNDDDQLGLQALQAGAVDYLSKSDASPRLLGRCVRYNIERARIAHRLKEKEERLLRSQKLESLGLLAGGVAHEFNNLLQAIRGYTNFAMKQLPEEGQPREDLAEVIHACDRAAELTGQLLNFSRRSPSEDALIRPEDLLDDLTKLLRPLLGEPIRLEVDVAEGVGLVRGDRSMLEHMLLNLCINARNAMPEGGTLTLSVERCRCVRDRKRPKDRAEAPLGVWFRVSDTGIGMSEETIQHIFEPFFTTAEVGEGTGLGLAMVYGTVQQHRGSIRVDSQLGRGTTFSVCLPCALKEALSDAPSDPARESEEQSREREPFACV